MGTINGVVLGSGSGSGLCAWCRLLWEGGEEGEGQPGQPGQPGQEGTRYGTNGDNPF